MKRVRESFVGCVENQGLSGAQLFGENRKCKANDLTPKPPRKEVTSESRVDGHGRNGDSMAKPSVGVVLLRGENIQWGKIAVEW